jgi:anti-sigma factor ChrR (cupin superfamily)
LTNNGHTADGLHELAPLYAAGMLEGGELEAFERHLRNGCETCDAELRSFSEVSDALAELMPAAPPASLRGRLLEKARASARRPGILAETGGILISRSSEIPWKPFAPGMEYKPLYTDRARRYRTSLVRMDAGARIPSHRHKDVEEVFLLSGDLTVLGERMRPGDYCRANPETVHVESFTDGGCVFLLLSSQKDELLA